MSYIAKFLIYQREVLFSDAGLILETAECLDDLLHVKALKYAGQIAPLVDTVYSYWHTPLRSIPTPSLHDMANLATMLETVDFLSAPPGVYGRCSQARSALRGEALSVPEREETTSESTRDRSGYVYLLKSDSGSYKIGRSKRPDDRLATFSVKLPFPVRYVCLLKSEDMYSLEKELHARFEQRRIDGEWFALSQEDISYIKSLGGD